MVHRIVWVAAAADVDLVVEVRATPAIEDRLDREGEFVGQIPSLDHIKGWEVGEEEAQVFRVASELLLEHRALRNLYERGTSDLGALAVGALATGIWMWRCRRGGMGIVGRTQGWWDVTELGVVVRRGVRSKDGTTGARRGGGANVSGKGELSTI